MGEPTEQPGTEPARSEGAQPDVAQPDVAQPDVAQPQAADLGHPDPPPPATDLGRRRFFRQLGSDLVQTAATVVGAANALQRTSVEAAGAILDPVGAASRLTAAEVNPAKPGYPAVGVRTHEAPPDATFRTAFRLGEGSIVFVDQRRLPDELVEYECGAAVEVAQAIRERVVVGGPAVAQAAAIGLAMAAERMAASAPYGRRAGLRGSANALNNADPGSFLLRSAVERMLARYEAFGELSEDGPGLAAALRAEAYALIGETIEAHGKLAELALAELPSTLDGPLRILTAGSSGVLAGGQFGTALGVVSAAMSAGRDVRVVVAETRPAFDGSRLAAWELKNLGIPCTVVADAAAPGRIAAGEVDVVLVAADRVLASGEALAPIGSLAMAAVAARHDVPFVVCAPLATLDLATADAAHLAPAERGAGELAWLDERRLVPADGHARNIVQDLVPAELISAIATEAGIVRAPVPEGLAALAPTAEGSVA